MNQEAGIVSDGGNRAYQANIKAVRAEVEKKYADQLVEAGFWKRIKLRRQIEKEVQKRMKKIAPPGALYAKP